MKKMIYMLLGMAFTFAFSAMYAYGEDMMPLPQYPSDKMISDDDLSRQNLDQDRGTVNQAPSRSVVEGSGAGGISGEADNTPAKSDLRTAPVEKTPADRTKDEPAVKDTVKEPDGYHFRY